MPGRAELADFFTLEKYLINILCEKILTGDNPSGIPVQRSLAGLAGEALLVVDLVLAEHLLRVEHSEHRHIYKYPSTYVLVFIH